MYPKLFVSFARAFFAAVAFASVFTAGSPAQVPTQRIALDEVIDGEHFWKFLDGREFPGAKGTLALVKDQPAPGQYAMKLDADFSKGGAYVAAVRDLTEFGFQDVNALHLRVKTENAAVIGIRLGDGTGQTHQKKDVSIPADGQWHDLVLKPGDIAGGEHWGGANDGKWHGAPKYFSLSLANKGGEQKAFSLFISDVWADAVFPVKSGIPVYREDFEQSAALPEGWKTEGDVKIDAAGAFRGKHALVLEKTDATLRKLVTAAGPSFPVTPGMWEFQFACKTELDSMDNSYNGTLSVVFLNAAGESIGSVTLAEPFRKTGWKPDRKQAEVPAGAVSARFAARINKETLGKFWVDELGAAAMAVERKDDRIKRLTFTTAQLGNLLYPEDSREVAIEVLASKPLSDAQKEVYCVVKDFWGAEQTKPVKVALTRNGKAKELFRYEAKVSLAEAPLEIGRYYELHGWIPREDLEPFVNTTSLAILPEAAANSFRPEEIPFTSRNWDNRITEYVKLTQRLGIRICGVWGRMESDPKKVAAPQLELIEKLGMGYLTGSPAHDVEQRVDGWREKYNEEALRQGVRNFFEKYGRAKPVIVNLGNEPHSKGEDVKADVDAYRIVYTEIKKIDPSIFVVGTSVGLTEDYFKYGFGEWCDAYDFHSYESPEGVRDIVGKLYPEMFKKYGFAKPVWCTEIGLNSQGMSRQLVAATLYKKFANFFAGGGANVSWFGLLYPDPSGKNGDSFSSAHNVFDCRFNKYAPKLDAIAYYNAVNGIAIKKFVEDKTYDGNTHLLLFRDRDGKSLQIAYKDKGAQTAFVPLPGVHEVQVIRIDGARSTLDAGGKGITLSFNEDPVLLLYDGGSKQLPAELAPPVMTWEAGPASVVRGESVTYEVNLHGVSAESVSLQAPPFWKVEKAALKEKKGVLRFTLRSPEDTTAREAALTLRGKGADGKTQAEITRRLAVTGSLTAELLPVPVVGEGAPAVDLRLRNNSPQKQQVKWDVSLLGEQELKDGKFTGVGPTSAFFAEAPTGSIAIEGQKTVDIRLPLAEADLFKVYRARVTARDASGRVIVEERPLAAFYGVPKAKAPLSLDGALDEADWQRAPVRKVDKVDQFFAFEQKEKPKADWTGPQDLSAEIRYLWDDQYLYVGVKVSDDIAGKLVQDGQIWFQDGLQFLVDPMRTSHQKAGKYDYALGIGKKGSQVWCYLSADAGAPSGEVKDMKLAFKKGKEGTGDITYEIAIPWSRVAPFQPAVGADLGFTLIVNEDDGNGRDSFMTWFGNAHNKDVDTVGDLVLQGD